MDEFWFMEYERAMEDFLSVRIDAEECARILRGMGMDENEVREELSVGNVGDMSPEYSEAA